MQNERQRDIPGNVGSDDRQQHGYPCTTRSRQPHSIPPTDHTYDEVILSMDSVRTQLGEVSTTTGRRDYCPRNINVDPREGRPYHVKVSLILIQTRRHPLSRLPIPFPHGRPTPATSSNHLTNTPTRRTATSLQPNRRSGRSRASVRVVGKVR